MQENYKMTKQQAKQQLRQNGNRLVDDSLDSFVSLHHINKIYPGGVQAVFDFNLEVAKNDFVALVGPSGCGKSTTLRMIAGLEEITSGSLYIDRAFSNYLPSRDRDIAMVFQSYALYPQMTVYDNIAFGLTIRKLPKEEIERRVFEAADILDLGDYLDRRPKELSGGQMQRVALGRAIVRQAHLFLMDEPLSNLDAKLRVQMRSEIVRIHREVGATTIYVTHDQTEAMTMANVIVVMNRGFIQQVGRAMDVYRHPDNLFVATFIGSPAMNVLDAEYRDGTLSVEGGPVIENFREGFAKTYTDFCLSRIAELKAALADPDSLTEQTLARMRSAQIYKKEEKRTEPEKKQKKMLSKLFGGSPKKQKEAAEAARRAALADELGALLAGYERALGGGKVRVGIRPENVYPANDFRGTRASAPFRAVPSLVELLGNEYILHFPLFGTDFQVKLQGDAAVSPDGETELVFDVDKLHVFDVESGLTIK